MIIAATDIPEWVIDFLQKMISLYGLDEFSITAHWVLPDDPRYKEDSYAETIPSSPYLKADFYFYSSDFYLEPSEEGYRTIEHEVLELFLDFKALS